MQQKEERKKILVEKAPMLEVKLLEGNAFKMGENLKINALGLVGSMRDECEDHYSYFGSAK